MRWKAALVIPVAAALATWAATPAFAATGWVLQTTPNPSGILAEFNGVSCTSATFCVAVGDSEPNASTLAALIERWNGSTWALQTAPSPAGAVLFAVSCVSTTSCETVGEDNAGTLAEHWNGSTWSTQTIGGTLMQGVSCTSATFCIAVGNANVEVWNGSSWAAQAISLPANSGLIAVSCSAANACTAVGTSFSTVTGLRSGIAEQWNGSAWSAQAFAQPGPNTVATGVSCPTATSCMAIGSFGTSVGTSALSESWNGSTWTPVATVSASVTGLNGVSCVSATDCTAVGTASTSTGTQVTVAQAWNGSAWTLQTTPNPAGATASALEGVSCPTITDCTAAGLSRVVNPTDHTLAEQWTG